MKILLIVITLMASFAAFGQIGEVSEVKAKTVIGQVTGRNFAPKAKLFYQIFDTDTMFTLQYMNDKYERIVDYQYVSFQGGKETLDQLYDLMMTVFKEENKKNKDYKLMFELGNEQVMVANYRLLGSTACYFSSKGGYVLLSQPQLNKLFGK